MNGGSFAHLQVRSHYSLMRGTAGPEALCAAARDRGMRALAITDLNGLYGAVRFWEVARGAGIDPILGAEVDARDPRRAAQGERAVLLVKSRAGYSNLCRLVTRRHLDPAFDLAASIAELGDGLLVLAPSPVLLERVARERGPRDLYLALGSSASPAPAGGWLARLQAARRLGFEPVAVNEVHFVEARDFDLHRLLRAIALNTTRDRVPPEELASPQAWLKTPAEMERAYPHCPEALTAAARLAAECALGSPPWGDPVFPRYADLAGAEAATDSFAILKARCEEGARARYGDLTPAVRARLERELGVIRDKGFADYFLVVQEIVRRSPRTCGRGSAAASIVSYCLGITHVEPIRHDLYFERFLNAGRVDPPDIDVDFCWDERDDVLDWVFRTFGGTRAAMIANHVTFRARAAVREVAKVHGLPEAEIKKVTDRLALHGWSYTGLDGLDRDPLFRGADLDPGRGGALGRPPWPGILAAAARLEGIPRHLSVHCGGVVIAPDGVDRHVPLERAAKGVLVIQWEKDQAEEAGLVKIDLLGNRSLAVIRDACRAVRAAGGSGPRFDEEGMGIGGGDAGASGAGPGGPDPLEDPRTQEILRDGETMGVFYVESPAMRQLQQKTRRGDFEHLVIHSSIIRPAANDYIREYVRRLRGGAYVPLHPILEEVLSGTYGIMCYQEDVARVAIRMAGFTDAEADALRKVLSKKWAGHRLEDDRQRFFRGAFARGVAPDTVEAVWRMILSFSGYSFCKPHSASYALVSFRSAYLKAHHPAEFMAAVLSNGGGYYSTFAYVSECRRMGLEVRLPDINDSDRGWTGRSAWSVGAGGGAAPGTAGVTLHEPAPGARGWVRVGLQQIKGLREEAIEALLLERRRSGPYLSFDDFLRRVPLDPSDARLLIRAGVFDRIGFGAAAVAAPGAPAAGGAAAGGAMAAGLALRPGLHWRLREWEAKTEGRRSCERSLFPPDLGPLPGPRPYDEARLLRDETETLGVLLSRHPLTLYRDDLLRLQRAGVRPVHGSDLAAHTGRRVATIGWLITGKLVTTKDDEPMEFVSFEDTTAIYETTFFPRPYARFCGMLTTARPYLLRGRVEEEFSAVTLTVDEAAFLDRAAPDRAVPVRTGRPAAPSLSGAAAAAAARAALPAPPPGPGSCRPAGSRGSRGLRA